MTAKRILIMGIMQMKLEKYIMIGTFLMKEDY
jgi:hypothetical protein